MPLLLFRRRGCVKSTIALTVFIFLFFSSTIFTDLFSLCDWLALDHLLFRRSLDIEEAVCAGGHYGTHRGHQLLTSESEWVKGIARLNVHQWVSDDFCLSNADDVYWNPLFPKYPSRKTILASINDRYTVDGYAIRRFVFFLRPKVKGEYLLRVGLMGALDMRIFVYGHALRQLKKSFESCFTADVDPSIRYSSFTSQPLYLEPERVYLFDIVHWMMHAGRLKLLWKPPDRNYFELIENDVISAITVNSSTDLDQEILHLSTHFALESELQKKVLSDSRRDFYKRKQLQARELTNFPNCEYRPSYIINETVEEYTGLWKIKEGSSYPSHHIFSAHDMNNTLSQAVAKSVAHDVVQAISKWTELRSFKLEKIVFIEENKEAIFGHRYFVELDIFEELSMKKLRLSDYFYKKNKTSSVCFPKEYKWDKNVQINIIFTTSTNQRKWVLLTLDAIAKVVHTTGDRRIHVIVADFSTLHINFDLEFKKRNLNYTVVHIPGKFNKVKGINRAANTVKDPNSIIFTIDLHLQIPLFFFDEVRKNTVRNKTVYAPVLIRLPCGKHVEYTDAEGSSWVMDGFGVLSMYKEDWNVIGGMNEKRYGEKWGGEDWEIIDRIISKQYEVIQRRLPGYYHIYHSRKGSAWYD